MTRITWLDEEDLSFPPVELALKDPDGLLAMGGDLSPERLLLAYSSGIFPWFDDEQPPLWWSPNPRAVLFHDEMKISHSLAKRLKQQEFEVKINTQFEAVIDACAKPRKPVLDLDEATASTTPHTWITQDMRSAYVKLHQMGYAHSVECFKDQQLVGGLYGVSIGSIFFGESMFFTATDASKVAFAHLNRLLSGFGSLLIDCQIENDHLTSLGCRCISREEFQAVLHAHCKPENAMPWSSIISPLPPW